MEFRCTENYPESGILLSHGGARKRKTKCGSSSIGTRTTCRQEPTEDALVVSAVGEERAEACVDEKSAEVGGASSVHVSSPPTKLPPVLPPQPEKPKRLAGYTVIQIISSGSYGDVYKVSKKDSGDLFVVKVMLKHRQTVGRTEEQQRELSIMKKLSGKHPNIMSLLGW